MNTAYKEELEIQILYDASEQISLTMKRLLQSGPGGMLVDNSIVVPENLALKVHDANKKSIAGRTAEIIGTTWGSTLTSIIVFLPLLLLKVLRKPSNQIALEA